MLYFFRLSILSLFILVFLFCCFLHLVYIFFAFAIFMRLFRPIQNYNRGSWMWYKKIRLRSHWICICRNVRYVSVCVCGANENKHFCAQKHPCRAHILLTLNRNGWTTRRTFNGIFRMHHLYFTCFSWHDYCVGFLPYCSSTTESCIFVYSTFATWFYRIFLPNSL